MLYKDFFIQSVIFILVVLVVVSMFVIILQSYQQSFIKFCTDKYGEVFLEDGNIINCSTFHNASNENG